MRIRFLYSLIPLAVVVVLAMYPVLLAQTGQQDGAAPRLRPPPLSVT